MGLFNRFKPLVIQTDVVVTKLFQELPNEYDDIVLSALLSEGKSVSLN